MPQSTTARKGQFLAACVLAAEALYVARNEIKQLAEEYSADSAVAGIAQADIDAVASPPPVVNGVSVPVAHLTPTLLANLLTVVQPAIETNFHLANVLAVLPS